MALLAPPADPVTHTLSWSVHGADPRVWLDAGQRLAFSTGVDRIAVYGFDAEAPVVLVAPVSNARFHYDPAAGLILATDGTSFFTHAVTGEPGWRQIDTCKSEGRYQAAGALRGIVLQCLTAEGSLLDSPAVIEPADAGAMGARATHAIASGNGAFVVEFDDIDWQSLRVYRVGAADPLEWPADAFPQGYIFAPPQFFADATRLALPGDSVSSRSGSNMIVNLPPAASDAAVTVAAELTLDRFGFGEVAGTTKGDLVVTGPGELSGGDMRVWSLADAKTLALLRGSTEYAMPVFHPSGQLIAAMKFDGQIGVWTIAGELIASAGTTLPNGAVRRFAFSPTGDRIIVLTAHDRSLQLSGIDLQLATQPVPDVRKAACAWLAGKTADNPLSGVEGEYFSDGPGNQFTPDELAYDPVLAAALQRLAHSPGAQPDTSVCRSPA